MRERSGRGFRAAGRGSSGAGRARGWSRLPRALLRPVVDAVMRQPAATLAGVLVLGFIGAIAANALYLQAGPHPAPLLGHAAPAGAARDATGSLPPVPRAENAGTLARAELLKKIQSELASRGYYEGAVDGIYGPRMEAAIREFQRVAGLPVTGEASDKLLVAVTWSTLMARETRENAGARPPSSARQVPTPPSRRIIAVQQALTEHGYGQLRPSGVIDDPTRTALEKFERQHKLPVRGQISERTLRELATVTGRPLD